MHVHPQVIAKRLDSAVVLVHVVTGSIFELNDTGGRIWELLASGRPGAEVVAALVDEFEVLPEQASRDFDDLLLVLRGAGLVLG